MTHTNSSTSLYVLSLLTLCIGLSCYKTLMAASVTASVTANIIITMSLSTLSNMAFGDISAGSTSGSVVLSTTGDRTSTGGATINSAELGSEASFIAGGESGATFSISMPASIQLTDPSNNSMTVDTFVSDPKNIGQLDSSGNKIVAVGATLHINSKQAFGAYTGLMALNVDYN